MSNPFSAHEGETNRITLTAHEDTSNRTLSTVLTWAIALLSLACCLAGLLTSGEGTVHMHQAVTGEWVRLYGKGLYLSLIHISQGIVR